MSSNQDPAGDSLPPAELCRFRSCANGEYEAGVYDLLRGRLRFKDISTFNDPFEGRPQYVAAYEDAGRQRQAMIEYLTDIAPIDGSRTQKRQWAIDNIRGKSMQEIIDTASKRAERDWLAGEVSVLCFSAPEAVATPLPWSHYADSHRGICVHFDTSMLPLRLAYKVEYSDEYPCLPVPRTAGDEWKLVEHALLRKCTLWAYEHEYRVIRFKMATATRARNLFMQWDGETAIAEPRIITAITLGARMDEATGQRLIAWIAEHAPHVEVWKAILHRSRYEVVRERAR